MQQLTFKISIFVLFFFLVSFLLFVLIELKPFVLKGKSWGINDEKV